MQLVQIGHVCLEAGNRFEQPAEPCNLVLLGVPSEADLLNEVERLHLSGIQCTLFYEPDQHLGYTAACTQPVQAVQRRFFRRLLLWALPGEGAWVYPHPQ